MKEYRIVKVSYDSGSESFKIQYKAKYLFFSRWHELNRRNWATGNFFHSIKSAQKEIDSLLNLETRKEEVVWTK